MCSDDATYAPGIAACPTHDEPLCHACLAILANYEETGTWEGVESDPYFGRMRTVCAEPGCPELVLVAQCWCYDHLGTGCEGCPHPAHTCDAPEHYCPQHGRPEPD
jgi:hypothetical protein